MLFLESENKIIKEVLSARLGEKYVLSLALSLFRGSCACCFLVCSVINWVFYVLTTRRAPRPVEPLEIRLCDFDGNTEWIL